VPGDIGGIAVRATALLAVGPVAVSRYSIPWWYCWLYRR